MVSVDHPDAPPIEKVCSSPLQFMIPHYWLYRMLLSYTSILRDLYYLHILDQVRSAVIQLMI